MNRGPPPVPTIDPVALIPAEAAAIADVYTWWTGAGKAPWMIESRVQPLQLLNRHGERRRLKSKGSKGKSKKKNKVLPVSRRTTVGNALYRLNSDLSLSLSALGDCIPFCGKTVTIQGCDPHPFDPSRALRLMVVFWSPSKLVATQKTLHILQSSEGKMMTLLEARLQKEAFPTVVTVTYLLPRWKSDLSARMRESLGSDVQKPKNKYMATPPSNLAWGAWQLGIRVCLLRPHAVLSTSADLARILGCTGGLDVIGLCTPEGKRAIFEMPPPAREPPPSEDISTLSDQATTVHRKVLNLNKSSAPAVMLRHPERGETFYHLRCPHPYILTRKPLTDQEVANQVSDRNWFNRLLDRLVRIGQNCIDTTTPRPKSRVVIRLGKRPRDASSAPQPNKRVKHSIPEEAKLETVDDQDTESEDESPQPHDERDTGQSIRQRQCYLVVD